MARFSANEADNYGGQGGAGFFRLANDGDVARVRFMYNSIDDVEGVSVHIVELNGKKRYVNCLRDYNDPIDKCPFCRERMAVMAKLFVPVYDVDEDRVKIWERGKKFFNKISGLCSRYKKLVEKEFDIERHGKAGSTDTTYEIFPVDDSEKLSMKDLPEIPEDFAKFVLEKSAEDMEYYLEEGQFPPEDDDEAPRRRGSRNGGRSSRRSARRAEDVPEDIDDELPFGNDDDEEEEDTRSRRKSSRQNTRRTPANGKRRRSDDEDDEY